MGGLGAISGRSWSLLGRSADLGLVLSDLGAVLGGLGVVLGGHFAGHFQVTGSWGDFGSFLACLGAVFLVLP